MGEDDGCGCPYEFMMMFNFYFDCDALRHIFDSRIADIKDSPTWNKLKFVSCACNGLVLMDESLQLLPVVETLDLSRNKFTKVDNLRKCAKLKHLDLGFNHLRSIAAFRSLLTCFEEQCSCYAAWNRKSEITRGLDLSYTVISNFSELEVLAGLPSLCGLWLEGNPVCCARWYRAQVFSFISDPYKLKLDEENTSTREFWKRQFIIANRQKQPASYGFFSPARDEAELEGSINTKRKKASRLACIASEDQSTIAGLDNDSVSCDNEARSKHENSDADETPEVVDLMNKIELMKRERSILWVEEFKEWMNQAPEDRLENDKYSGLIYPGKEKYSINKTNQNIYGEKSTNISDPFQYIENPFSDFYTNSDSQRYSDRGRIDNSLPIVGKTDLVKAENANILMLQSQGFLWAPRIDDSTDELGSSITNHHPMIDNDDLSERSVDDNSFVVDNNNEDPYGDKLKVNPYGQTFDNMEVKVGEGVPLYVHLVDEMSSVSNGNLDGYEDDEKGGQVSLSSDSHITSTNVSEELYGKKSSTLDKEEHVSYLNGNIADSGVQESCRKYIHLLEEKSGCNER